MHSERVVRRFWVPLVLLALGCRGGVIFPDSGPGRADAGTVADAMPPMDATRPPPPDGAPPPPPDGAPPPPPPDGAPPPPPDGAPPPPPDGAPPPLVDGGSCDLAPRAGMRCCFDDADCGTGPGGLPLRCYGAACASGGEGQCVPPAPAGRCFGDLDCASGQSCTGGSLGCDSCSGLCSPPVLGTCG